MNIFMNELKKRNMLKLFEGTPFKPIAPANSDKFASLVKHIVDNNLKVYIDPDCDLDGFMSAKNIKLMFDKIDYKNYVVGQHKKKRHVVPLPYVTSLVSEQFDVFIFVDSSTNNMDMFNYLNSCNKLVAVIDHHTPSYTFNQYPPNTIVINPRIENVIRPVIYKDLSAGAVSALVCAYTLNTQFNIKSCLDIYMNGYVTLYSDSCDMYNEYNIAYARAFQNKTVISSDVIQAFMSDYDALNSNFCSFKLAPRLNSLCRSERFDLLHKIFFGDTYLDRDSEVIKEVEEVYNSSRAFVMNMVANCELTQYESCIVAKLPEDVPSVSRNFTGLIATKLAHQYNQTCVLLMKQSDKTWGGSVRDPFGRDLLSVFKIFMKADGHPPAFGITTTDDELNNLIQCLSSEIHLTESISEDMIVVDWDRKNITESDMLSEMDMMAEYNEFCSAGHPKAIGVLTTDNSFKFFSKDKCTFIYGKGLKITCFVKPVTAGDTLLITPSMGKGVTQLICNNVKYK